MAHKPAYWPDGYTAPKWLPNWQNEAEYIRLLSHVDYTYTTTHDPDPAVDLPDAKKLASPRRLKQGSVKSKRVDTCKNEFAWEFLRRNPYYQADYQRLVELAQAQGVDKYYISGRGFNILSKGDAAPPSLTFHAELYRTLTRWDLGYRLLDPSCTLHEAGPLQATRRLGNDFYLAQEVCDIAGEPIPLDGGIILTDSETLWLFDVSLPLQPQLEQAKLFLDAAQVRREGKKLQKSKTEISTFLTYLRLLDADVSGADDDQIATVLFLDKLASRYHNNTPHRDTLNKARIAANALKDRLYRHLL